MSWQRLLTDRDAPGLSRLWLTVAALGLGAGVAVLGGAADLDLSAPMTGVWLVFCFAAAALFVVDTCLLLLPTRIIYTTATLAAALLVTASVLADGPAPLLRGAACAAAGVALYATIWLIAPVGGFGLGDVRLAGLIGLCLGATSPVAAMLALAVLPLLTAPVTVPVVLALRRWLRQRSDALAAVDDGGVEHAPAGAFPFGPFMIAAAWLLMAWPDLAQLIVA